MKNGIDPEDRININDAVSMFIEVISNKRPMPPLAKLSEIFVSREMDDEGNEISYEDHVEALSSLLVSSVIMLAEERLENRTDEGFLIHVLMSRDDDDVKDNVTISVTGFEDPRFAVAALASLERQGYIQQLWNVAVRGRVDPDGPHVVVRKNLFKRKEES